MAVNTEVNRRGVGPSLGFHGVIKFDDNPGVKILPRGSKWLQGVPMN